MKSLSNFLDNIEVVFTEQGYTSEHITEFELYLPFCKGLLADLGKGMDKYHNVEDGKPTGLEVKPQKPWEKPKQKPGDIMLLRCNTIAKVGMMTPFYKQNRWVSLHLIVKCRTRCKYTISPVGKTTNEY